MPNKRSIKNIKQAPTNNEILCERRNISGTNGRLYKIKFAVDQVTITFQYIPHPTLPKDIPNLYFSTSRTYYIIQRKLAFLSIPTVLKKFKYCRFKPLIILLYQ